VECTFVCSYISALRPRLKAGASWCGC